MKRTLSTIFMICIIAAAGFTLHKVTLNRTSQGCIQLNDFYHLPEDTVDLLCIGSSHVYYSIHTCRLYDRYGIAGYLLASPGQPVWLSYYFLEEALKTQSPQLLIFDVCTLYRKESSAGSASWPSLISMKPSVAKWKAIRAVNWQEKQLDSVGAFFSFPYYHTRYAQLDRQDYENTKKIRYNGYFPSFDRISESELADWKQIDRSNFHKSEPVSEQTELYFRKLIELCREKNIPLLLVNAPYLNQTEEKQKAYNYISQIAKEYGIPFLDCSYIDEIQIDYAKDLLEPSHLNYYGSMKYTDYLAEWISKYYTLPDRRENSRYQIWEETSRKFRHVELYGRALKQIDTLEDYRKALRSLDECVVVLYQNPGGKSAVYENGKQVFAGAQGTDYFWHTDLGYSDLAVQCVSGNLTVSIDNEAYSYVNQGLNILVYDKVAKCVIDGAGFDVQTGKAVREKNM